METKPKHAGGRPSTYSPEILIKTEEYLVASEDQEEVIMDGQRVISKSVNLPTLEGLAFHLKVHKDTIQDWKGKYPEFSVLIGELLAKQAKQLVNKGLSGDYNSTIAKLLLVKHGYRDAVDSDVTSKGEQVSTISPEALALAKKYEDEIRKQL